MSWLGRLIDRIDAKLDRPADQSVLDNPRGGSERMIEAPDAQQASAAATSVRHNRNRSRRRWRNR